MKAICNEKRLKSQATIDNVLVIVDVGSEAQAAESEARVVPSRSENLTSKYVWVGAAVLAIAGCLLLGGIPLRQEDESVASKTQWPWFDTRRSTTGWGQIGESVKYECLPGVIGRKLRDEFDCVFVADDCHLAPETNCQLSVDTWENAESRCQNFGGHLVSITSEAENDNAFQLYIDESGGEDFTGAWIGLSDNEDLLAGASEGHWQWKDGSESEYTAWAPGEPNQWQGEQDCAAMVTEEWDDRSCTEQLRYMCSIPLPYITITIHWYFRKSFSLRVSQNATVDELIAKFLRLSKAEDGWNYVGEGLVLRDSTSALHGDKWKEWDAPPFDGNRTLLSYDVNDGDHLEAGKMYHGFCDWGYCK